MQNKFADGIRDGIPIALGYFSVSFAFGMTALTQGVPLWAAVAISFTCLTSAGQFAGLTIIAASGSLIEMALSQFVINLRYFLMSLSLTQKVDPQMPRPQRAIISFGITDEIFALSSSRYNGVGFRYMVGLMTLPIAAWTLGTLCGGVASGLLPQAVRDALGIMIYGMFLAIILPPCRKSKQITAVVACASLLSCLSALLQAYVPISSGFVIIICTVAAASLGAWRFPVQEEKTRGSSSCTSRSRTPTLICSAVCRWSVSAAASRAAFCSLSCIMCLMRCSAR